jgi:hypothetical protein
MPVHVPVIIPVPVPVPVLVPAAPSPNPNPNPNPNPAQVRFAALDAAPAELASLLRTLLAGLAML